MTNAFCHKHTIKAFTGLVIASLTLLSFGPGTWLSAQVPAAAAPLALAPNESGIVVTSTVELPAGIQPALLAAVPQVNSPAVVSEIQIVSLDQYDEWAVATVVFNPSRSSASTFAQDSNLAILHRRTEGAWEAAFWGSETYAQFLAAIPDTAISEQTKPYFLPATSSGISTLGIPTSLKLPWKSSQTWAITTGNHGNNNSAFDFAPYGSSSNPNYVTPSQRYAVAAAAGVVIRYCTGQNQAWVMIRHSSGGSPDYWTGYLHLDKNTVSVTTGMQVRQGQIIGTLYNSSGTEPCSPYTWPVSSSGPHLHFSVGTIPTGSNNGSQISSVAIAGTVLSGWTVGSNGCLTKGASTVCRGGSLTSDNEDNATVLAFGQTQTGDINPAGEQDRYYFDGTASQSVTIEMTKVSGSVDPFVSLYRPNGVYLAYNDDGAGFPNARLMQVLPDTGRYTIVARSYSSAQTGTYTIKVSSGVAQDTDDNRFLANDQPLNGTISPNTDADWYYFNGITGRIIGLRMDKSGSSVDSYLELYSPNGSLITYNDNSGGNSNAWLVTILTQDGVYRVKARSAYQASNGAYTIRLRMVDPQNYALYRPAYASSTENSSFSPYLAVDGRLDTRWSTRYGGSQYLYVDLGQNRAFDTTILRWGAAYGKRYGIYTWTGSSWQNVAWTDSGRGGTDVIRFSRRTARYVMIYAVEPGTIWGYSLWELGIHDSTLATAPTVPPDDPPDGVGTAAPLPLPEDDGSKEIQALYLGEADTAQEVSALPGTEPSMTISDTVGQEGIPTASIDTVAPAFPGDSDVHTDEMLEFSGSAVDNDANGTPGIVAYEWRSDRDGVLSTQSSFTMLASALSIGQHVISFRAQDNEGNWSPASQVTIQVTNFQLYLPLVIH